MMATTKDKDRPTRQAFAIVRQGQWFVLCPRCRATHNAPTEDRQYFCLVCHGGIRVVWPDDREDIELLLGNRPLPEQRNWEPPETVGDLRRENIQHGVVA
jgi:hypothetical protein